MIDDQTLERIIEFHGHMCPGVAMGIQAATIARRSAVEVESSANKVER